MTDSNRSFTLKSASAIGTDAKGDIVGDKEINLLPLVTGQSAAPPIGTVAFGDTVETPPRIIGMTVKIKVPVVDLSTD